MVGKIWEEEVLILCQALEEIRQLTFEPYCKNSPTGQRPATLQEKLDAWAKIQATAARALREVARFKTEDDP
jgi:hypothetical protein